ncbi:hypothetical protein BN9982_530005 [Mycobacterium tuberculosis]|nr:hypothetical protein BN9982_530005 [Mycobacterium tuberculosis]
MTLTPFNRVQTHEMFKHLNHTQPNRRLQRPPPHPASPAANQLHCGWAATLELDRAAPQRPIPARIVATLGSAPWRTYSEPRPCTWPIRLRWCSRQSRSGSTTGRASASSGETATANPVCWACSPVNCGRTPVGSPGVADCG